MTTLDQKVGRLALREEGENWNAYYAMPHTMDGATFLGSIRMGAIADNLERRNAFVDLMRDLVGDLIEHETGVRPTWGGLESAPESERSGKA